jgi:hypothetical protein
MNKGYFSHNVFERIDACNRTTIYFKEDTVDQFFSKGFQNPLFLFSYWIVNYSPY